MNVRIGVAASAVSTENEKSIVNRSLLPQPPAARNEPMNCAVSADAGSPLMSLLKNIASSKKGPVETVTPGPGGSEAHAAARQTGSNVKRANMSRLLEQVAGR